MQEVKFNYRNIAVEVEEDAFVIRNKHLFVNTGEFDCVVILEKEGNKLQELVMDVNVEPGESARIPSPVTIPELPGEYAVTVSFRLKRDAAWAEAGHEVAFGQGVFTRAGQAEEQTAAGFFVPGKPFEVIYGTYNLGIRGMEFEALFSYNAGGLTSYRYGGKELLKSMPKPNFWRAPVDNDCGNDMMARYGQWKLASLYVTNRGVSGRNPRVEEREDCVLVVYQYKLPVKPEAFCELRYRVFGDGTVETTLAYDPVEGLGDMPEFGVICKMDADYCNLEWYGNGPQETYADRQHGAKLGLYRNKISDNMARYLVPQECGNKTGVRYAKVTDDKGRGLIFAGDKMYFSALPFTPHELENAAHAYELPTVHYTVIRAALGQMGVAGDDSWGSRVHDEYLLPGDKRLEFTFCFKGL